MQTSFSALGFTLEDKVKQTKKEPAPALLPFPFPASRTNLCMGELLSWLKHTEGIELSA